MLKRLFAVGALVIAGVACAAAPKPTAASVRIAAKAPAIIEGRVRDAAGRPIAGIAVRGIPRGADIQWAAPAITDCDGRFRLSVPAPAAYGFLLAWKGTAIITPDAEDPALVAVAVEPGGRVEGVALTLDREAWRKAGAAAPEGSEPCP